MTIYYKSVDLIQLGLVYNNFVFDEKILNLHSILLSLLLMLFNIEVANTW